MYTHPSLQRGFTLMELIIVIVIAGILGTMTVGFITKPMEGYMDLTRRAELVDAAEMSLRHIGQDIRRALPNSIVVSSGGSSIHMVTTLAAGRYRALPDDTGAGDILDFTMADTSFEIIGNSLPPGATGYLVIYSLGVNDANIYANDPIKSSQTVTVPGSSPQIISLAGGHQFPFPSPRQRVYLIPANEQVVRYYCDAGGTLYRAQCDLSTAAAAESCVANQAPVSRDVASCQFDYAITAQRTAVANLQMGVSREGETVSLLHQVFAPGAP